MAQIIDQIVKISIQDAISSATTTDVNTIALVGQSSVDGAVAGSFADLASIVTAYGADSVLAKMAETFFAQDAQPNSVVCVPAANFAGALNAVETASGAFDFYHICYGGLSPVAANFAGWQTFLANAKKVLHVQIDNSGASHTSEIALAEELADGTMDRIALYVHTDFDGNKDRGFLNVAIVALRCAFDSAKGTFAHKKCKGVVVDDFTTSEYTALINSGLNIYVKVAGEARLFMGTTCNKTSFIDQKIKDDWIRFNTQSRIYALLGEANDGAGVNYDDAGIASVAACVSNVFNIAADTNHQYIMEGASVDFKTYSYLKENYKDDVMARNLPLIKGTYSRMNSVHTVNQVTLQVTL